MESIPQSQNYEKLDFSENPFEKLPRELLLPIVKFTSDLASVWSLSSVSPAVYLLIDDFGKEIVETVLEESEPWQTRVIFNHIVLLKLGIHPSTSLDEFKTHDVRSWTKLEEQPIDPEFLRHPSLVAFYQSRESMIYELLPNKISPAIMHAILRAAYKIDRLTHLCHKHFLDRCKILEFSEPIEVKNSRYYHVDVVQSQCREYLVHEVDPPSWIELKTITRAFWYIQAFYELKNNSRKLQWASSDLNSLQNIDIEMFIGKARLSAAGNAALTVVLYLKEADKDFLDQPEKHLTSFLHLPHPVDTPGLFLPTEQKFEDPKSDLWRQSVSHLDDLRGIPGLLVPMVPSLPEFPPIPNPPCFKFLDIFSIDCPDKSKSTSTFQSGKLVEPTCTSNCGSPCTANCHTTGTPTSTKCATETATNYWVSCASSTCVNTSSNTVTGSAVEPSVTTFTATDYCPLVAIPTGDDEGSDEDRPITPFWTVIQTTISERVSISGYLYTVTSGSITVNGVGYSVPAVVTSSVMVLGGLTATLYPPAVVSYASITAPGYGTIPLTPTSTVAPVQSTTTSSLPIPTRSDLHDTPAYCFRQHNDGNYVPFNLTGEHEVLYSICNQGNTLSPGSPAYTYVYTDPTGVNVIAQVNWASDQTGCNLEDGWPLASESDICEVYFVDNVYICDDESTDDNYGGAHIWDGPFGCIEYMIYAVKSGSGSSSCSCFEDGCTTDSLACCADGTCDNTQKSVMNRVTLIPGSLGLVGDQNATQT